jgi:hypothetical protein
MDEIQINDPWYPSRPQYMVGIDPYGKLTDKVFVSAWKRTPDGKLVRVYPDTEKPGINPQKFRLKFDDVSWMRKGDFIAVPRGHVKVTKVYRDNLFKRLWRWLGFRTRINQVDVRG